MNVGETLRIYLSVSDADPNDVHFLRLVEEGEDEETYVLPSFISVDNDSKQIEIKPLRQFHEGLF